jgi:hypothetical protein
MRINVRISGEDQETLRAEAARLGVSVSDVVRMILRSYMPEFCSRGTHCGHTQEDHAAPRTA